MYPRPKSFKLTPQQLIPEKGLVFDWILDKKNNGTWLPWTDSLNKGPSLVNKILTYVLFANKSGLRVHIGFLMSR